MDYTENVFLCQTRAGIFSFIDVIVNKTAFAYPDDWFFLFFFPVRWKHVFFPSSLLLALVQTNLRHPEVTSWFPPPHSVMVRRRKLVHHRLVWIFRIQDPEWLRHSLLASHLAHSLYARLLSKKMTAQQVDQSDLQDTSNIINKSILRSLTD